jgi:hypothetical protein
VHFCIAQGIRVNLAPLGNALGRVHPLFHSLRHIIGDSAFTAETPVNRLRVCLSPGHAHDVLPFAPVCLPKLFSPEQSMGVSTFRASFDAEM